MVRTYVVVSSTGVRSVGILFYEGARLLRDHNSKHVGYNKMMGSCFYICTFLFLGSAIGCVR